MSAVPYVPGDDEVPPRPKPLPRTLLTTGEESVPRLPPDLVFHNGARKLLLRTPATARALIVETCGKIPEFFGINTRLAIKEVVDVGNVTVECILYLVIVAQLSALDASNAYDRFLDTWWLDNVERGQGCVHIGLELL